MNINELRIKLREAFSKVKSEQENLFKDIDSAKKDLESIKSEYASKEKLNLLKLKIGEINETLKKIWDLEQDIKSIDEKTVNKSYFSQQLDIINEDLDDIKKGIATLNKEYVSEFQVKELVDGINKEFNDIKEKVTAMKSVKDTITSRELRRTTKDINSRIDEISKSFKKAEEEIRQKAKKNDDDFQEKMRKTEEHLKKKASSQDDILDSIKRSAVEKKDFDRHLKVIEEENHELKKQLKDMKIELRELEKLRIAIKKIEKGKASGLSDVVVKKTVVSEAAKDVPKFKIAKEKNFNADTNGSENSNGKGIKIFANILIVLAFVALIAAIGLFFTGDTELMTYPTVGAIGLFLVGIIIRIALVVRSK